MKKLFFISILVCLTLPVLQGLIGFVSIRELDGSFENPEKINCSLDTWFKSDFQSAYYNYFKCNIGFRNFFVRLYNQIDFSLFKIPHCSYVIIGKNNVLYQDVYFDAYQGKDFIGKEMIQEKLRKLKFVQDTLEKQNIYFLFLIAPGKVSFMPDNVPPNYDLFNLKVTNYDVVSDEMKFLGIHHIDFRKYFLKIKDTISHPLFPKCGTHWSGYALTLVADSVFKYFENRSGVDLPDYKISAGYSSKTDLKFTDDDLVKAMNLLYDIESYTMYYPTITFLNQPEKQKPSLLTIGDSFNKSFWGFYPYFENLFSSSSRYWYYNHSVDWPDSVSKQKIRVSTLETKGEIRKHKFILIVSTEQNLSNPGFGFIEDAYDAYTGSECENRLNNKINLNFYADKIRNNKTWLLAVTKKSIDRHIELNMMISLDASWVLLNENKNLDLVVKKIMQDIKSNPDWLTSVTKKAIDNNVTLDEMVSLDAIWVYFNQR